MKAFPLVRTKIASIIVATGVVFFIHAGANDSSIIPWASAIFSTECKALQGWFEVSGEVVGGESKSKGNEKIYERIFPFVSVSSEPHVFSLEQALQDNSLVVSLIDDAGNIVESEHYKRALKCEPPWFVYFSENKAGGDGSAIVKVERVTKFAIANDGSLIIWSSYEIIRRNWFIFTEKNIIVEWRRYLPTGKSREIESMGSYMDTPH